VQTKLVQAPALDYIGKDGVTKTVRFDGIEKSILIDRKISVVTTEKAKNQALRQSEALRQNNLTARWEVPNATQLNRAQKMLAELNIENIKVGIADVPKI
jgi:filamentous hemagglutinin